MIWLLLKLSAPLLFGYAFYRIQLLIIYPSYMPEGSRNKSMIWTPSQLGLNGKEIAIMTRDGVKLQAYHITGSEKVVVLWFHGNAGNMGHRLPIIKELQQGCKCHFLIFDYRGYGASEGTPYENGLKIDSESIYLYAKETFKGYKIVLAGQSLGGAAAIHVATTYKDIDGMILENTFTSLPDVIPHILPSLSLFKLLCVQRWNSLSIIHKINSDIPILFMSSGLDEIIPKLHMQLLYQKIANTSLVTVQEGLYDGTKWHKSSMTITSKHRFHYFPQGTHNELPMNPKFFSSWSDFLKSI